MTSRRTARLSLVSGLALTALLTSVPAHADVVPVHVGGSHPFVDDLGDPSEIYIDLSQYADEMDTVYQTIPTRGGTIEIAVFAYNEADDSGGGGGGSPCPDSTASEELRRGQVFGGVDEPRRYDAGNGNYYVQGSALLHSCVAQPIRGWVFQYIGWRKDRTSYGVRIDVPARKWVRITTNGLACDPYIKGESNGWMYTTYFGTDVANGEGMRYWDQESAYRSWPGC